MTEQRFDDVPAKMRGLPIDARGYSVPWFVPWVDGRPIFPAMDAPKLLQAWRGRLCWVCGKPLGRVSAFVIGPMCAINRTSAEPPSHLECARFSARRCPFLSKPEMARVGGSYKGHQLGQETAGVMIPRNPGVTLVWQTLRADIYGDGNGRWLFDIGKPHAVEWYARGRPATRAEVLESIESGIPILLEMVEAEPDPDGAAAEIAARFAAAIDLLPGE
jgi:hypothetical protein